MQHITRIGPIVLATLALAAPHAIAQDTMAVGKKGEVELRGETRVGSTVLKPGHYQFQHVSIDGQHYLVVREQSTVRGVGSSHYGGAAGKEVARVPCRLVAAPARAKIDSHAYYTKEADGSQRLTQIHIRGEKEGHMLTLEPVS